MTRGRTRPCARSRTRLGAVLLALGLLGVLAACTTDQVLDPARYWSDRLVGATLDADPSDD